MCAGTWFSSLSVSASISSTARPVSALATSRYLHAHDC